MIDTLVLRIHDLAKYSHLVDFILSDRKGTSHGFAMEKEVNHVRFRYMHFTETDKSMMMYRSYIKIPSSNYDANIAVIQFKDYIELSFSVPKFIYGTNVLMFTKHQGERYLVNMNDENDIRKVLEYTFSMLSSFIRSLWLKVFPENHNIDLQDVEIKRMDLCWNQVFQSESDAKMYLMYQKMIKKRGTRDVSESKQTYETSIFYNSEYYSAKIYHKGTEYRKNDRLKHLAANKKSKVGEIYPIEDANGLAGLQTCADKILRYEISFKKNFWAYYYWRYFYRKDVLVVSQKKKIHREMTNSYVAIDRCVDLEKKKTLIDAHRKKYPKAMELIRRDVQQLYDKVPLFMLKPSKEWFDENQSERDFFEGKYSNVAKRQLFTKFLWNQMAENFMEFYDQFQVKEKVYFHDSMKRISDYNDNQLALKKVGLDAKTMRSGSIQKVNLLLQHYSMDELKRLNIVPKRTFYDWKKKLKKLGIEASNVATISIPVIHGKEDYHAMINNSRLINYMHFDNSFE